MKEFYIITIAHKALWPRGVLLFWGPNNHGYSTCLEQAGRYSEEEAKEIVKPRDKGHAPVDFMVPCEQVEAQALRVVDSTKFTEFTGMRMPR